MRTRWIPRFISVASLAGSWPAAAAEMIIPCEDPLPELYIVGVRTLAGGSPLAQLSSELTSLYGGEVRSVYHHGALGFSTRLSEAGARRLARDPRVAFIEQDCPVYPSTTQTSAPWSLDRIDQSFLPLNNTYTYSESGGGVNIYVIDTGVSPNSELGARLKPGRNFASGFPTNDTTDCWGTTGHGTAVAGLAAGLTYGVAKGANVHPLRVFNCTQGTASWVRAAVDWMITNHVKPAVANMSFWYLPTSPGASSMETSIQAAFDAGIVMVASANNNDRDACIETPSRIPDVVTVGASDITDMRAIFNPVQASNFGTCLDLWAPGKDNPSIDRHGDPFDFNGTSASAPLVSGAVALYLETNPSHGSASVSNYVATHATVDVLSTLR